MGRGLCRLEEMSGWPGPDSEEVTDWQERQVVSTADTLRVQGQPAARPGGGAALREEDALWKYLSLSVLICARLS